MTVPHGANGSQTLCSCTHSYVIRKLVMMKSYSPEILKTTGTLTIKLSTGATLTTKNIHYLVAYRDSVIIIGDPLDSSEELQSFIALSLPSDVPFEGDFNETYPDPTTDRYRLRWQVKYKGTLLTATSGTVKGTTGWMYNGVSGSFTMIFDDNTTAEGNFEINAGFKRNKLLTSPAGR